MPTVMFGLCAGSTILSCGNRMKIRLEKWGRSLYLSIPNGCGSSLDIVELSKNGVRRGGFLATVLATGLRLKDNVIVDED